MGMLGALKDAITEQILKTASDAGLTLDADDIYWEDSEPMVDGLPFLMWLADMTQD